MNSSQKNVETEFQYLGEFADEPAISSLRPYSGVPSDMNGVVEFVEGESSVLNSRTNRNDVAR